ncbi:MAG: Spy/CpxP family protein refolding chaperone [Rubrivivax sp.]|nr:Spy/CpxP family protein refolding chaperone [Rubrivivax sp.]
MSKTIFNTLMLGLAGASLLASAAAIAGGGSWGPGMGPFSGGPGHGGFMSHGVSAERADQMAASRLDALKKSLALQPQQEPAWSAFRDTALAQAKQMGQARQAMGDAAQTLPQRQEQASRLAGERLKGMDQMSQALKTLYGALTPEQRKVLDSQGHGGPGYGGRGRHG